MKEQNDKLKEIFLVISGYRDDNQVRYLTFEYNDALSIAKKIVSKINRSNGQKNRLKAEKFYSSMQKDIKKKDTCGFGEVVIDHWNNNISFVEIILFKIDKEYSPDWNAL